MAFRDPVLAAGVAEPVTAARVPRSRRVLPSAVALDSVLSLYLVRGEPDVRAFLSRRPFLLPLLREAHQAIQDYIGPGTTAVLEVLGDSEDPVGGELFALAQVDLSPSEALRRLRILDEAWWLEASERADCQMNVSLEFV